MRAAATWNESMNCSNDEANKRGRKLPCSPRPKVALRNAWRRTRAASTRAILRFCTDAPRQPAALTNKMSCGTVEVTFPMLLSVILIGDIAMALSNRIESSLMQLKQCPSCSIKMKYLGSMSIHVVRPADMFSRKNPTQKVGSRNKQHVCISNSIQISERVILFSIKTRKCIFTKRVARNR